MTGSESIRWLFDLEEGGSPKAFVCLLPANWRSGKKMGTRCCFVAKTLRGMRAHQREKHAFVPQKEMFDGKSNRDQLDGSHV